MPKLQSLTLLYSPVPFQGLEREWEDSEWVWLQVVEKFIQDRVMTNLEDLSISCIRPLRLAPTVGKSAPNLKRLVLKDNAPPTLLPNYSPANMQVLLESCSSLEILYIDLPYSILEPNNEVWIPLFASLPISF